MGGFPSAHTTEPKWATGVTVSLSFNVCIGTVHALPSRTRRFAQFRLNEALTRCSRQILCVDDRPTVLQFRKSNLERLGCTVLTATNLHEAVQILERMPVVSVILDYDLRALDAEAIMLYLKQRFSTIPIVLASADSDVPERILWLVDAFAMRSEPFEQLAELVERVIRAAA